MALKKAEQMAKLKTFGDTEEEEEEEEEEQTAIAKIEHRGSQQESNDGEGSKEQTI